MPGTEVAIGLNSPRTSLGAAGFMSHISRWLGPPFKKTRMQESALGVCPVPAERELARSKPGRFRPNSPMPPTCSMCRREILRGPAHSVISTPLPLAHPPVEDLRLFRNNRASFFLSVRPLRNAYRYKRIPHATDYNWPHVSDHMPLVEVRNGYSFPDYQLARVLGDVGPISQAMDDL